jgi:hypothetical protein
MAAELELLERLRLRSLISLEYSRRSWIGVIETRKSAP